MLTVAQLHERRCGIGSSEIGAICGLSSWTTPIGIWLDKTGQRQEVANDNALSIRFEIGHALEPLIARLYTQQTGVALDDPKTVMRSAQHEWQLASPDRIRVGDACPVECKSDRYSSAGWGEEGTDEVPTQYICQVQWQMDVLGAKFAHVAALLGERFKIFTVRYDADLCGAMREAAERFWVDYVLAGVQPPVTAHEGDTTYLQKRFALYETGKMLTADVGVESLAAAYAEARAAADEAAKLSDTLANQMREVIGDAEGVSGAGWKATWKAPKAGEKVDWEAVARELGAAPELIQRHTSLRAASRRFLFTKSKGGK